VSAGATVGVDGNVLGLAAAHMLQSVLEGAGIRLRTDFDALAEVWPERPGLPTAAVYEHHAPHAPLARATKLAQVREAMAQHGASHHFVSTVDDIAWLFNLRGADVSFNPVFLAHALIEADHVTLFVGENKVGAALQATLAADAIHVAPYAQAASALAALPADAVLLLDPRRVTFELRGHATVRVVEAINPSTLFKSRKNADEAAFVRAAMAQDGAAMCEFYAWFEAALGKERITELTVDEQLSAARAKRPGFVGLSFNTIAAFNPNGAMPHYHATPESHAVIEVAPGQGGLLLIDSGGQYLGGTTDITRVWPIGQINNEHRRDYTLVLKGTMALSRTRFPRGTLSPMLDAIARATVATRPGLRPRHRPRCRLFPERARGPAEHLEDRARHQHGDGARHDHEHRAGLVPAGPLGHPDREPGAQRAGHIGRFGGLHRVRRVPRIRNPHAEPDRHPLHRAQPAAARRDRLAQRLPRDRARAPEPARDRASAGLAAGAHHADLRPGNAPPRAFGPPRARR
jgi:Xaa-Pro aminopeptidase